MKDIPIFVTSNLYYNKEDKENRVPEIAISSLTSFHMQLENNNPSNVQYNK